MKAPQGKWIIHCGTHQGPQSTKLIYAKPPVYDSAKDALAAFDEFQREYKRNGYLTWFASMYDDQGNRTVLADPVPFDD